MTRVFASRNRHFLKKASDSKRVLSLMRESDSKSRRSMTKAFGSKRVRSAKRASDSGNLTFPGTMAIIRLMRQDICLSVHPKTIKARNRSSKMKASDSRSPRRSAKKASDLSDQ